MRMVNESAWILLVYLDAALYFKNKFVVWWAAKLILQGRFKGVILSFIVPGHTKFQLDVFFSKIANRFYKTDMFNTSEYLKVIGSCDAIPSQ